MGRQTGRRQFLQSMAATTAASSTACQQEVRGGPSAAGGTASVGGAGGLPSAVGGSTGGTIDAAGGSGGQSGGQGGGQSGGSGGTQAQPENTGGVDGKEPPRPTSPIGVALLGLGKYAGERLAPALQLTQHCKLVGIVTGTPSKIPTWQAQYGIDDKNVYTYDTLSDIVDNPDIHVVYIVTPNHVHAQFAIAAANAKKHVWCEKPMAMTPQECQSMMDACTQNGVKLSIGYRLQHEPNTQTVIGYASSKPFGAIAQIDAQAGFNGFGPGDDVWRLQKAPGGGALFDMGIYCINASRYALGEEPSRVLSASQWTDRPDVFTEVDEFTEFELEFPSGAIAYCRTSFGERMDRLEVTCASGNYKLEPFQGYTGVSGSASDGTQFNQSIENQQAKQMDDDALAIIEGTDALVPGEEGQKDVRIIQAIVESATSGQAVDLP